MIRQDADSQPVRIDRKKRAALQVDGVLANRRNNGLPDYCRKRIANTRLNDAGPARMRHGEDVPKSGRA